MRTVSAASHVVELVAELCDQRGVARLTEDQAAAVTAAIERIYGVPLDLPTAQERDALRATFARTREQLGDSRWR